MLAYKLLRLRRDGSLGPLFINRKQRVPFGRWLKAEDHPTPGYERRPGWHCCTEPSAPHLKTSLSSGEDRLWCQVEVKDYKIINRPTSQGGEWILAKKVRLIGLAEARSVPDSVYIG